MTVVDGVRSRWAALSPRRRQRYLAIAVGTGGFMVLSTVVGSALSAAVLVVGAAALMSALVIAVRMAGLNRHNRAVAWLLERAWRDANDVLAKATADMDNLVLRTSAGPLAPRSLILGVHQVTFEALTDTCEPPLLDRALTSAYEDVICRRGAEVAAGPHTVAVHLRIDPAVGRGQWTFTSGRPAGSGRVRADGPVPDATVDASGPTQDLSEAPAVFPQEKTKKFPADADAETVDARLQPEVRPGAAVSTTISLLTGSHRTTGTTSPCTVGRGRNADLQLPDVLSISRAHAVLTRHGPTWWIECTGRNGLLINGAPVSRPHRLRNGDTVHWGTTHNATASRVHIDH